MKFVKIICTLCLLTMISGPATAAEHVVVPYTVSDGQYWTGLAFTSTHGDTICVSELDASQNVVAAHLITLCNPYQQTIAANPATRMVHCQGAQRFYVTRVIGDQSTIIDVTEFESQ